MEKRLQSKMERWNESAKPWKTSMERDGTNESRIARHMHMQQALSLVRIDATSDTRETMRNDELRG